MKNLIIIFLLLVIATPNLSHAKKYEKMANRIIKLRSQVEKLNNQVQELRGSIKRKTLSVGQTQTELESEIEREKFRNQKLIDQLDKVKREISKKSVGGDDIIPLITKTVKNVKRYINKGLPFKITERNKALDELDKQVSKGIVDPFKGANRLWAFVEDEFRMAKENGIYQQTIQINGQERLVSVAKIGMMMLFFKTSDNKYGWATKTSKGWNYKYASTKIEKDQVFTLFDSLKKQIRTGYFEIPNTLKF